MSAGAKLRAAIEAEQPLQMAGAVNAYSAMLAQRAGFRALYLSGAGVANHSLGLPDLGVTASVTSSSTPRGSRRRSTCRCSSTSTRDGGTR